MKITVKTYGRYAEVLEWLQDNIGPLLHSKPIIDWQGKGWYMKSASELSRKRDGYRACWAVEFINEKDAIWFSLLWG